MRPTTDSGLETQLIGRTINGYRVTELLGRGGMGLVYAAELTSAGTPSSGAAPRIALKVLHGKLVASDPTAIDRFVNEARSTARVAHPGLVKVLDFGHLEDGCAYIMMELLSGVLLRQRIRERAPMPYLDVCRLGRQIADALRAAHELGIVHRDLKPENLMLISPPLSASLSPSSELLGAEQIKVLDFGLAKLVAATGQETTLPGYKTATGAIMGTPTYMSPELCRANGGKIDDRSDVYSLAVVLFEMLAGRPPFFARAPGEVIAMHILEPAPTIATFVDRVPRGLQELLARMLAKKPEARPAMAEVFQTLTSLITDLPTQPLTKLQPQDLKTKPLPLAFKAPTSSGQSRRWVLLAVALIFSLIAALVVWRLLTPAASSSVPPVASPVVPPASAPAAVSPPSSAPAPAPIAAEAPPAPAEPAAKPKEVSPPAPPPRKNTGERRRGKPVNANSAANEASEEDRVPAVR